MDIIQWGLGSIAMCIREEYIYRFSLFLFDCCLLAFCTLLTAKILSFINGCARRKSGVWGVVIDMAENEVTIKGIVEPQAICNIISKKTKKRAQVISPLPEAAEGEPIPEAVTSQASEPVTVELKISMHCEACAKQLKRKILKMRGVEERINEFQEPWDLRSNPFQGGGNDAILPPKGIG
ncbi:hypothetical protein GLYMA_15G198801v4 [Glycine max]|nr:hypothetical protein GLYMA_15G198801v4 [Glycine max]